MHLFNMSAIFNNFLRFKEDYIISLGSPPQRSLFESLEFNLKPILVYLSQYLVSIVSIGCNRLGPSDAKPRAKSGI